MKKSYLIAATIGLFSLSASYAQDSTNGRKSMENRREAMYSDLNLTQDQKDKLKTLDEDGFKQMKTLREDQSLSDDQRRSKMMDIRKAQKEARDKILTKEQSEKLDAKMKEMRSKRNNGSGS